MDYSLDDLGPMLAVKEGHLGIIYQATNWLFLGAATQPYLKIHGKVVHPRTLYDRFGPKGQSVPWLREHVDPHAARVKIRGGANPSASLQLELISLLDD